MQYANKGQNDKAASIRRRRELVMRDEEESIQTKLEVSQPGDAQEQEADHIANKVVNGGNANVKQLSAASSTVQSKSEGDVTHAPDSLQRSLDSTKGQGQSMDDTTKSEMESKMGADFSGVKIHTGGDAHTISESVNAKAFTHGQDIYFKNGNYDPGSSSGKNLLAHELTHTVQNGDGGDGVQRKVWRKAEDPEKKKGEFTRITPAKKGIVHSNGARLFSDNKTENVGTEATLQLGDELHVLYETAGENGWYYARLANADNAGYIQKGKLTVTEQTEKDHVDLSDYNSLKVKEKKDVKKKDAKDTKRKKGDKGKGKKGDKLSKKGDKGKSSQQNPNEQKLKPVDLSDLVLNVRSNTADLNAIRSIEDLKAFAAAEKAAITQNIATEEGKLSIRTFKQQQLLNLEYNTQAKEVGVAFDSAISRAAKALTTARLKTAEARKIREAQLLKAKTEKIKSVDTKATEKQDELKSSGEDYAKKAIAYGDALTKEANTKRENGNATVRQNAENAAAPYSNYSNFSTIVSDVAELANSITDQIDQSTNGLNDGLKTDADDLAQKFRDDAKDGAENLPQSKDETKKQITAIYDQGLTQFAGVSDKPLAELEKTLLTMIAGLLAAKKQSLTELSKKKQQSDAQVQSNYNETKSGLATIREKVLASIDGEVTNAEQKTNVPDADKGQIVLAAARKIAEAGLAADSGVNDFLQGQSTSLQLQAQQNANAIHRAGLSAKDSAKQSAKTAEDTADNTVKGITAVYDKIVRKVTGAMDDVLKKYVGEMDKTISDMKKKWDVDLKDGTKAMQEKADKVFSDNASLVAGSAEKLQTKARDSAEENINWWDKLGAIFEGIWEAIQGIILVLAIIALIILAVVVLFYAIVALLTFFGAFIIADLVAVIGVMIAEAIVGFLVTYSASIFATLAVVGIVTSIINIFVADNDPTLSTRDRYKAYGANYFNLIISLFGLKGAKSPGGLLPALEEAPKPRVNVKGLFEKFWKTDPKAGSPKKISSQTFAEFEEWYLYQRESSPRFVLIDTVKALEKSITKSLLEKGVAQDVIDGIIIRAMYVDDAIGGNQMMLQIDELAKSPGFKNPSDLLKSLSDVFSGNKVDNTNALNLLAELKEGTYWIGKGDEVSISTNLSGKTDQVDVAIHTKDALVEVKTVSSDKYGSIEDNIRLIVKKYTVETKLSKNIRDQYPNHYGKLNITSPENPFYNLNKIEFIEQVKKGAGGEKRGLIGDEANQIKFNDMQKVHQLFIENGTGRFVIYNTDWK